MSLSASYLRSTHVRGWCLTANHVMVILDASPASGEQRNQAPTPLSADRSPMTPPSRIGWLLGRIFKVNYSKRFSFLKNS